jgi:4-hydroxy-2-oxoheptanedioate aldolase
MICRSLMSTRLAAAAVAIAGAAAMSAGQMALAQPLPLVNQGAVNPNSWVYGPRNDGPTPEIIWNPVKEKMLRCDRVIGRTVPSFNISTYCERASQSNADFTWTEMQHSGTSWSEAWQMWAARASECPSAHAMPGARVAYADEREIQKALDGGAMVLVVPTVDTEEEAKEIVKWAYFPPVGKHSQGGGQFNAVIGSLVGPPIPGGYRPTFNHNLVVIAMIETIEGVKNADKIAAVPGIDAIMVAATDLRNFSGYQIGDEDYEKLVTQIHDAAMKHGKCLCGPLSFQDRPGFSCFQQ